MDCNQKYDKRNWNTWKELISKYYLEDDLNKCIHCQFAMPDDYLVICGSTYYGKNINSINNQEKKNCDFAIEFFSYIEIGESKIDPEFNNYIKKNY